MLHRSFEKFIGRPLIANAKSGSEVLSAIQNATFAVVSHGTEDDPIFNYANPCALRLFETDWDTFVKLPSKHSAEAPNRESRQQLLETVNRQGYIDNYSGIRISAKGNRFQIINATVWNLYNKDGEYSGQAALIPTWTYFEKRLNQTKIEQQQQQQ